MSMGSKGRHELRKTIIRMLKDGWSGKQIAKNLGVSEGHVSNVKKLFLRHKKTLDLFLERGAISQAQHNKSLHDMIEKMGAAAEGAEVEKRFI